MSSIDIDTIKLNECVKDFDKQVTIYKNLIEDYFKFIKRIPDITKEWEGSVATNFINNGLLPKEKIYKEFGSSLELFSSKMKNCSEIVQKSMNNSTYGE